MIHHVSAFQFQEEQSRIFRLLHIEYILYIEIVPHEDTVSRVFEASPKRETRDSGLIRKRAVPVVQGDQLGFRVEDHVGIHLDHRS